MSPARSRACRIGARLLGLALVAWVVATQVRWSDEVTLADDSVRRGRLAEEPGGRSWTLSPQDGGPAVRLGWDDVRRRTYGGREVPSVAYGFPTLSRRLSRALPEVGTVLAGLFLLTLLTAWRWRWLVRALGLDLTPSDAVRYTLYGVFFNLVVPGATGGDVVKAYYAAKRTGVATKAVVSVFVDRLVGLFALVLFAAVVLWLGPDHEGFGPARLLVAVVLGAALFGGLLFLSRRARRATGLSALLRRLPFQHVWEEVDAAFRLYRRHPKSLLLGMAVSFANHAGGCLCAYLLARALGLDAVTPGTAFALVPVVSLLAAIPVLPGGFGVGELAFAYFFGQVGVPATEAVALSVAYRLSILLVGLPGGVLWVLSRAGGTGPSRREMAARVEEAELAAEALAQSPGRVT